MFPDLRLLISATVATFFLAATAGLYASLRITQDQLAARTDGRAIADDSPITRISAAWPLPEPGRAAALRDLMRITKIPPIGPEEPAIETQRGDKNAGPENPAHALLNEGPANNTTGSTGSAISPDVAKTDTDSEKAQQPAAKKALQVPRKKSAKAGQPKKAIARAPEQPADPTASGYPLYLTVPVSN